MEYKSQYGQDKWIIEDIFPQFRNGYFVDLAAGDGEFLSNSYILEKEFGWNGICIEPNNTSFNNLKSIRNCICDNNVVLDDTSEIDFIEYEKITDYEHLLSTINGASAVDSPIKSITKRSTKSLNSILDEYKAPDIIQYISLDIEGSEIYVLQEFLPKNNRIILSWSIEINLHSPHENLIKDWMQAYGYEISKKEGIGGRLGHDYLFILKNKNN